jgi:hypothetical protein
MKKPTIIAQSAFQGFPAPRAFEAIAEFHRVMKSARLDAALVMWPPPGNERPETSPCPHYPDAAIG